MRPIEDIAQTNLGGSAFLPMMIRTSNNRSATTSKATARENSHPEDVQMESDGLHPLIGSSLVRSLEVTSRIAHEPSPAAIVAKYQRRMKMANTTSHPDEAITPSRSMW